MLGLAKGSNIVTLEAHRYRRYRLAVRVGRVTDAALDFALWAHNQGLSDAEIADAEQRLDEGVRVAKAKLRERPFRFSDEP